MPNRIDAVHSPQMFALGMPSAEEICGLNPSAPPTPVLKMPISTLVAPTRSSLITEGEKVCVSPRRRTREFPNSLPARKPDGKSLPVGEVPIGKLLSRARELLSLL